MKNIIKTYLIGALIIYPIMLIWAFSDIWSNNTNLHFAIMKLYGILLLPILGKYYYTKNQKLLAYIFFIISVFLFIYIILFKTLIF
jgi:hypothetical protein